MYKRLTNSSLFLKAVYLLIFLPYIGYGGIGTDIQPWAALLCAVYIIMHMGFIHLNLNALLVLATLSLALTFFQITSFWFDMTVTDYLRQTLGFLTPMLIFMLVLLRKNNYLLSALDMSLVVVWIGIILNVLSGDTITSFFVNRAVFAPDGRGFPGFYPEQSRVVMHMIMFAYLYFQIDKLTMKRCFLLLLPAVFSGAGQLLIHVMLLLPFLMLYSVKQIRLNFMLTIAFMIGIIFIIITLNSNLLFFARLYEILNLIITGGILGVLVDNNAFIKFTGLIHGVLLIISGNFLCLDCYSSAYSIEINSLLAKFSMLNFGLNFSYLPPKPYSIFTSFMVYGGFFGLLAVIYMLLGLCWTLIKSRSLIEAAFVIQISFMFFVRSFPADPLFWLVFFFVILRLEKVKNYA